MTIKDFEFLKVLGRGGFATVYMVRNKTNGRLYAMKAVKKQSVADARLKIEQVIRERNILT